MSLNPHSSWKDSFVILTSKVLDLKNSVLGNKAHQWQKQKALKAKNSSVLDNIYLDSNLDVFNTGLVAWWAWPTILSLDAPIVAVIWQFLLADSFELTLKPLHSLLLFATVWLIYVVDRCFDSVVIAKAYTARHGFYKRYFSRVFIVTLVVLCCVMYAAIFRLEPPIFLHGIILSGVVLLYLANLHLPKKPLLLVPKELQIGLVFAAGSTITFWSQLHTLNTLEISLFLTTTLCFAALCFLNCSLISLWEKSVDILHKQPSLAHNTTSTNSVSTQKLSFLVQSALVLLVLTAIFLPIAIGLKVAFVFSSLGLLALQIMQAKTSVDLRRVLADVVLMSPLLTLLFQ